MSKFFGWFKKNKNQPEEPVSPTESDVPELTEQPADSGTQTTEAFTSENTSTHRPETTHESTDEANTSNNAENAHVDSSSFSAATDTNQNTAQTQITQTQITQTQATQIRAEEDQTETAPANINAAPVQPDLAKPVTITAKTTEPSALTEQALSTEEEGSEKEQPQEKPKEKPSFFSRLKRGLAKTKANIGSGFANLFSGKKIDDDLFEELETQLLMADLGVETTTSIIDKLTESAKRSELKNADTLYPLLKEHMSELLLPVSKPLQIKPASPYVILMVGVNGVGKTTTIGKMAKQFQAQGKKVMLAAGDTFRAAAVEQLKVWGERNQIPVVSQATGSDSASVIFDAVQSAKARGMDILIADTAGRLQNKNHLMEELKKIVRVMQKLDPDAPHEIMLTIDASTGQNAISQTALFQETVGLTGITLTKLDGTAKGGVIFALADKFQIPIRFIGIGEGIDDLRNFNGQDFVDALFDTKDE